MVSSVAKHLYFLGENLYLLSATLFYLNRSVLIGDGLITNLRSTAQVTWTLLILNNVLTSVEGSLQISGLYITPGPAGLISKQGIPVTRHDQLSALDGSELVMDLPDTEVKEVRLVLLI